MPNYQIEIGFTPDAKAINRFLSELKGALGVLGKDIKLIDAQKFNSDLAAMKKGLDGVEQAANKTQAVAGGMGKAFQFNQALDSLRNVQDIVTGIAKPFVELDTATARMNTLGAEARGMSGSLRAAAIDMSKTLPVAAGELQGGMADAMASGVKGGEEGLKSFAEISAKLSTGGGAEFSATVKGMGAVLNAFGEDSSQTGKYADYMFNIVNAGVTSIDELNAYLSTATPTASRLGIGFDQLGGSIALATQKGVPTAQFMTKINALMLEMEKPGTALAPIMQQAGVSLASLRQDGLPASLDKINNALKASGKTAASAFSSSEAGAAFSLLTSQAGEFQAAWESVRDTTGSTDDAYAAMSESIEVRAQKAKAANDAFVIESLDKLGGFGVGVITATQTLGGMQSQITALAGLQSIIPSSWIANAADFAKIIISKVVPGMFAQTVATVEQGTATAGATAAQWLLNAAMLANPALLLVAAVAAAAGAFLLLRHHAKDLTDATKDASSAMDAYDKATAKVAGTEKQIAATNKLVSTYDKLKDSSAADDQAKFADAAKKINDTVPGAVEIIDKLDATGKRVGETYRVNTDVVKAHNDELRQQADLAKADALASLIDQTAALGESYTETVKKQQELRIDREKLQKTEAAGNYTATQLLSLDMWGSAHKQIKGINEDLAEQSDKLEKAKPVLTAAAAKYRDMGLSVEEIARRLNVSVEDARHFGAEVGGSVIQAKDLEAGLRGVGAEQARQIRMTADQANAYKNQQIMVEGLQAKLASQKAMGVDTKETEKSLADAQKLLDEKKLKLQATIEKPEVKKAFDGLSGDAQKALAPVVEVVQQTAADAKAALVQEGLGQALSDALTVKAGMAEQDGIADLVTRLKNAKSEAERNDIAATLAARVPEAIAGVNKVTGAYEINTDKVMESVAAQKAAFGPQQAANTEKFTNGLKAQADTIADNKAKMADLGNQITEGTKSGKDVGDLKKRYDALGVAVAKGTEELGRTVQQGKRVGLIKGDVHQLGAEFTLTGTQATTVSAAVHEIETSTKAAIATAADLADTFDKAAQSASKGFKTNTSGLVQVNRDIAAAQRDTTLSDAERATKLKELQALKAKIIAQGRADYAQTQRDAKDTESAETALGKRKKETSHANKKEAESAWKQAKDRLDLEKEGLAVQASVTEKTRELARLRTGRERDTFDDIVAGRDSVAGTIKEVEALYRILQIKNAPTLRLDEVLADPEKINATAASLELLSRRIGGAKVNVAGFGQFQKQMQKALEAIKDDPSVPALKEKFDALLLNLNDKSDLPGFRAGFQRAIAESGRPEVFKPVVAQIDAMFKRFSAAKNTKELDAFRTTFKGFVDGIGADAAASALIGVKLKPAEKGEAAKVVAEYAAKLREIPNKAFEVRIKATADQKRIEDEVRALDLKKLEFEVEVGITPRAELLAFKGDEVGALLAQREELQAQLDAATPATTMTPQEIEALAHDADLLRTKLRAVDTKIIDAKKARIDEQKKLWAEEMQIMHDAAARQEEVLKHRLDAEKAFADQMIAIGEKLMRERIAQDKELQLRRLDQAYEVQKVEEIFVGRQLISEKELAAKKQAVEDEARRRDLYVAAASNAARLTQQHEADAALLAQRRGALQKQYDTAFSNGDIETASKIDAELQGVQKEITEKGSTLTAAFGALQDDLGATMGDLFSGNKEAMHDSAKQLFGAMAGIIRQLASTAITGLLLSALPTTGFFGLFLLPVLRATVGRLVDGLVGSVVNDLLSFPTGGRFDSPQLAMVGDAGRLGGPDREWLFRDEHIRAMLREASGGQSAVVRQLQENQHEMRRMLLRLHVRGRDVVTVVDRVRSDNDRRLIFANS